MIFDDTFSTVDALQQKKELTNWENLCKFHAEDYCMDPFTNAKETSTELQNEVNEWLAGEGVDTVTDAEAAFDDVVVDELDGIENNLDLPLNDEPTQDSTAREGEESAVQFDLGRNTVHEYDASSDDGLISIASETPEANDGEDQDETPKAWRPKQGPA